MLLQGMKQYNTKIRFLTDKNLEERVMKKILTIFVLAMVATSFAKVTVNKSIRVEAGEMAASHPLYKGKTAAPR